MSGAKRKSDRSSLKFRPFDGLQIYWEGEASELEFIPRHLLEMPAGYRGSAWTAATTEASGFPKAYKYVATLEISDAEARLTYRDAPAAWGPDGHKWMSTGTTLIRFAPRSRTPSAVDWHEDDEDPYALRQGTEWKFDPPTRSMDLHMERARLPRSVTERPEQAWLRAALLAERGHCQVSKITTDRTLEACHIVEVKDKGNDDPLNALLLRRDLHALFDRRLLRFEEQTNGSWKIRIADEVRDDEYRKLDNTLVAGLEAQAVYLRRRTDLERRSAE